MTSNKRDTESAILQLNTALEAILRAKLGTETIIRFDLPKDGVVNESCVSVFLYQLTEDMELREGEPRQYDSVAKKYKVANVYLRCSYLITYWELADASPQRAESDQMIAISRITGALINNRELPGGDILFSRLMPSEHLNSLGNFWQALGNNPRICLTYDATIRVLLDEPDPIIYVEPVNTITVTSHQEVLKPEPEPEPVAPKKKKR